MLQEASTMILSLDAPLSALPSDDSMGTLADLLEDLGAPGPAEYLEQHETIQTLSNAIEQLPSREQMLLSLYYEEELTMKEISKLLHVSESRVCQLHMQAILRLRSVMNVRQAAQRVGHGKRQRLKVGSL
jgi:RNA polymerase sigma factor for flagellar operon FliA